MIYEKDTEDRTEILFSVFFCNTKEYGLPEPRFQEFDNMFRVELFLEDSTTNQSKIKVVKSVDVHKDNRRFGKETEKVRNKFGAELGERTEQYSKCK